MESSNTNQSLPEIAYDLEVEAEELPLEGSFSRLSQIKDRQSLIFFFDETVGTDEAMWSYIRNNTNKSAFEKADDCEWEEE